MKKTITTLKELNACVLSQMKRGVRTNFFLPLDALRAEIDEGRMSCAETDGFLALFLRRDGFSQLYYYDNGGEPSFSDEELICETVDPPPFLNACAFRPLLARVSLTRKSEEQWEKSERADMPFGGENALSVRRLTEDDFFAARTLLAESFSPRTAALPTDTELLSDCKNERIAGAFVDRTLCGLLRFSSAAKKAEIRHLCVGKAYRGKGAAKALCADFVEKNAAKTLSVWTGEENFAARSLYESFGFLPDGKRATVYSNVQTAESGKQADGNPDTDR